MTIGCAVESLEQLESGQPGHLDVEEQHVHRVRLQELERRLRIVRAAGDVDAAGSVEHARQPLHRQRFVVHEIGAHHVDSGVAARGSRIATRL